VLLLDSPIISHQKKRRGHKELTFVRVDSDHDNLIKKEENTISKLSDEEQEGLKTVLKLLFQSKLIPYNWKLWTA
jgi:molecular chaperone HtpG